MRPHANTHVSQHATMQIRQHANTHVTQHAKARHR